MPIGRIFGAQTAWTTVEIGVWWKSKLWTAEIAWNHSRHTRCEQVILILRVKCSYFEIFLVVNRPYFVLHTIPCNVFKVLTVPPESHNARRSHELVVCFFSIHELRPPVVKTYHIAPKSRKSLYNTAVYLIISFIAR